MFSSFSLLIISGLTLITLLFVRYFEIKNDRHFLISEKRGFADKFITKIILAGLKIIVKLKKVLKYSVLLIPRKILDILYYLWRKLKRRIDNFFNKRYQKPD